MLEAHPPDFHWKESGIKGFLVPRVRGRANKGMQDTLNNYNLSVFEDVISVINNCVYSNGYFNINGSDYCTINAGLFCVFSCVYMYSV